MKQYEQQLIQIPLPPKRKNNTLINIIVVFLSIILMCLLFFGVLAYFSHPVYPRFISTPSGALNFTEISPGNYTGVFITLSNPGIDLEEIRLYIIDDSRDLRDSIDGLYNHATLEVEEGFRCSFVDTNGNGTLDTTDTFHVSRVDSGDIIKLVYQKSGGVMAQYTFE